ncbi:hypothetical protein BVRB_6g143970 [Beta vulgaris subsp. vulgaris]|uniref:Uncharacterized protein n=1 Tax=Beta vulgaris subsp. vulgaris TaxID=3555 RepID=A0A0J8C3J0_BETVV|nr:hypothetical protein BVRB_6g143970 [Beta vulgaris subsp. vulgaris]
MKVVSSHCTSLLVCTKFPLNISILHPFQQAPATALNFFAPRNPCFLIKIANRSFLEEKAPSNPFLSAPHLTHFLLARGHYRTVCTSVSSSAS